MRPLPPELAKIALEQLNETPERMEQSLILLRAWIHKQEHLKARTSDEFLIAFLRRCRYSLEKTKKRIDNFFTFYHIFPEVLTNKCVNERLLDINRTGIYFYPECPKCDNQSALLVVRLCQFDPQQFHLRDFLHFFAMAMEVIALENDNATVGGICKVIDFRGISQKRLQSIDRTIFRKWTYWLRDCCPLRFKEVYFLHSPREIQRIMAIRRTLLLWRYEFPLIFLKDFEELYKHIPRKCLPEEYGGTNGHCAESIAYLEDLLKSYRAYFDEDVQYGTVESLRSEDITPFEAEFGASGSFRKLEVE